MYRCLLDEWARFSKALASGPFRDPWVGLLLPWTPSPCTSGSVSGAPDPSGLSLVRQLLHPGHVFVHGQRRRGKVVPDVSAPLIAETKAFLRGRQLTSASTSSRDHQAALPARGQWLILCLGRGSGSSSARSGAVGTIDALILVMVQGGAYERWGPGEHGLK